MMCTRRALSFALAVALMAPLATAQDDEWEFRATKPEGDPTLFYELPQGLDAGSHVLHVSLWVGGRSTLTETIELLTVEPGAGAAVDLLVFHPELRAEILALPTGSPVRFEVSLDGGPAADLSVDELRQGNDLLQRWGFTPVEQIPSAPLALAGKAAGGSGSLTCEQQCDAYFDQCESGCGVPAAEDCLERCDSEWVQCMNTCGQPPSCPTTREYTQRNTVNAQHVGPSRCLRDHLGFSGKVYTRFQVTDQVTRYRETTHCNGSKTTEVLSVNYVTYLCWARSNSFCSPWASNFGYFICG